MLNAPLVIKLLVVHRSREQLTRPKSIGTVSKSVYLLVESINPWIMLNKMSEEMIQVLLGLILSDFNISNWPYLRLLMLLNYIDLELTFVRLSESFDHLL